MHVRGSARTRGFTLVEILIAVAIFGLIGIVSGQLLMRVLHAQQLNEVRADRLADVQRALALFERDVLQLADRPIRDEFGDPQPALRLTSAAELELTRHGWSNPLGWRRSDLQRVRWQVSTDGQWQRLFWTVLDRAPDSMPREQTILDGIRRLEIELLDADGGSWELWPLDAPGAGLAPLPGEDPDAVAEPVALRLAIDVSPFGRIERLWPLPAPTPTLARVLPGEDDPAAPEDAAPVDEEGGSDE